MCYFGCQGVHSNSQIMNHMITSHSKEDLWRWSIKSEKLAQQLSNEKYEPKKIKNVGQTKVDQIESKKSKLEEFIKTTYVEDKKDLLFDDEVEI